MPCNLDSIENHLPVLAEVNSIRTGGEAVNAQVCKTPYSRVRIPPGAPKISATHFYAPGESR